MKNIMKGLIIFFSVLLVALIGLMTYGLVRGSDKLPLLGGVFDTVFDAKLINTQTIPLEEITDIKINNSSYDIIFMDSDSEDIVIKEYSSKKDQESFVTANKSGKTLNLSSEKRSGRSWFVLRSNYAYYELYLPISYKDAIDIETSSGDVFSETDREFSEFTLVSSSGYVELTKLVSGKNYIKTSSGDIDAIYLGGPTEISSQSGYVDIGEVGGNLKVSTSSGDIGVGRVEGTTNISSQSGYVDVQNGGGDTKIETSSGDITISNITGRLDLNSSSGYIKADAIEGGGTLKTSSGDVNLEFALLTDDLTIDTKSGYVSCEIPQNTNFQFQADTSSGDIDTDFDDQVSYNKKGNTANGVIGAADCQVTINTSSGDIELSYR